MQRFFLSGALPIAILKACSAGCSDLFPFDPQDIDFDGDGIVDVRYRQDSSVIANDPPPLKEAARYAKASAATWFLRAKGTQLNFAAGQVISSANGVQIDSGVSGIELTVHYAINYGFPRFVECGYSERPTSWNPLTNGIAGIRLQQDAGFHYGWIRFARPDLEPATPFVVVDYAYNPIPGAPIAAGEPPPLPPLHVAPGETGLTLSWDSRFPGLQLEWAEALEEPVTWQPVAEAGDGSAVVPPADANRFYRLRQP